MLLWTHGTHTILTETSKQSTFEPVSFVIDFILVSKPTYRYNLPL